MLLSAIPTHAPYRMHRARPILIGHLCAALAAVAAAQAPVPRLLLRPTLAGDVVVFVCGGDLWRARVGAVEPARQLTATPWPESDPELSADGKRVAFTGQAHGGRHVYVMSSDGGEPQRLTFGRGGERCLGWTHDRRIAFENGGWGLFPDGASLQLVSASGGPVEVTAVQECGALSFWPGQSRFVFHRFPAGTDGWSGRFGGAVNRLCTYDLVRNQYEELSDGAAPCHYPCVLGEDIYYLSTTDRRAFDLYRWRAGRSERLTAFTDRGIRTLAGDGCRLVFEREGELFLFDPATAQPVPLAVVLPELPAPRRRVVAGEALTELALAPDGRQIAVVARGDVGVCAEGQWRAVARTDGAHEHSVAWSPDGRRLVYASDARGEVHLHVTDLASGQTTASARAVGDLAGLWWSPQGDGVLFSVDRRHLGWLDVASMAVTELVATPLWLRAASISPSGRFVAYVVGQRNDLSALRLFDRETGRDEAIADLEFDDVECAFDPAGDYLYFSSRRSAVLWRGAFENDQTLRDGVRFLAIALHPDVPPPARSRATGTLEVDPRDLRRRTFILPVPAGDHDGLVAGARRLLFRTGGVWHGYLLGAAAATPLPLPGEDLLAFDARGALAVARQGDDFVVQQLDGAAPPLRQRLPSASWEIDLRSEWRAIYQAAWRHHRDHFYDAAMAGVDWSAVGAHYARYLPGLTTRAELNLLLQRSMGELPGSHNGIWASGDLPAPPSGPAAAELGALYSWHGAGVRITKILAGRMDLDRYGTYRSPLDEVGDAVRVGDYLVAIDGRPIDATTSPQELLLGKAEQVVTLEVNATPSRVGARTLQVTTIGSQGRLLYLDFIARTKRYVAEQTGGRVGYVHVFDTNSQGPTDFFREFVAQSDKAALIVDARWNRGGNTQSWIVAALQRRPFNLEVQRYGQPSLDMAAVLGPKVLLVNEHTASGGELLAYEFKKRRAGVVVGMPTAGRTIGVHWVANLIDGGRIATSESHNLDADTRAEIGEGVGVSPDLLVDLRPDAVAAGRDLQVERAVAEVLARLPAPR